MSGVKLKICGVKTVAEARQLAGLGVDYAGLNFIPASTRYISLETAEAIMAELKPAGIQTVALFADRPVAEVNDYARRLEVGYVQLHGGEPADYAQDVSAPVMRAIAVKPGQSAADLLEFISQYPADYFVLDRYQQGRGDPVDAGLAAQVIAAAPGHGRIFLAGGLGPDNLAGVLAGVRPYGIDIAGGVRAADDSLDIDKVSRCLELIR